MDPSSVNKNNDPVQSAATTPVLSGPPLTSGAGTPGAAALSTKPDGGHIDVLIQTLTNRADMLNMRNWAILGVTVAIIGTCIYIFWKSDTIVEHLGQIKALQDKNDAKRK